MRRLKSPPPYHLGGEGQGRGNHFRFTYLRFHKIHLSLSLLLLCGLIFLFPYTAGAAENSVNAVNAEILILPEPLPLQTPVQEFFGGLLLKIQTDDILPLCQILLISIAAMAVFRKYLSRPFWIGLSLTLTALLSVVLSLKVSEGWDELFINLRHSYVFEQTGRFSYNLGSMGEATADFLPFFLAGVLGKLSLPLVETILCITLLGNILLIGMSFLIARRLTQDDTSAIFFALGIGTFPCVVFVGGTGFTATLFTGIIFAIIYCLFIADNPEFCNSKIRPKGRLDQISTRFGLFWRGNPGISPGLSARTGKIRDKKALGLTLLSLLTLIRVEGVILAFLVWCYFYIFVPWRSFLSRATLLPQLRRMTLVGLAVASPFLLSALLRTMAFGYPIPNPVTFKSTGADPGYFMHGLEQLRQAIVVFQLPAFSLAALGPLLFCMRGRLIENKILASLGITALFCFVYFAGGGDWFPIYWNRYMMPFTLLFVLYGWCIGRIFCAALIRSKIILSVFALLFVAFPYLPLDSNNVFRYLAREIQISRNRWDRMDALGLFGRYLRMTTPPEAVIASPEMATAMYFAQRDILDLLGIASAEVAHSPLDPLVPGDLMHRRRLPQLIAMRQPGIIALYGMATMEKTSIQGKSPEELIGQALQRYAENHFVPVDRFLTRTDIAYYRAGSYRYLEGLGYHYLIVVTPTATFNYLVHGRLYQEHLKHLQARSAQSLGTFSIACPLNPLLAQRFSSQEHLLKPD